MKNIGLIFFGCLFVGVLLYLVGHGQFPFAITLVLALSAFRLMMVRHRLIYWIFFAEFLGMIVPVSVLRNLSVSFFLQAIFVGGEILYQCLRHDERFRWRTPDYWLAGFILMVLVVAKIRGFGLYALGGSSVGGIAYIEILVKLTFMLFAAFSVRRHSLDIRKCFQFILCGAVIRMAVMLSAHFIPSIHHVLAPFFKLGESGMAEDAGPAQRLGVLSGLAFVLMPFIMQRPQLKERVLLAFGCFLLAAASGFRSGMVSVVLLYAVAEIYMYRVSFAKAVAGVLICGMLVAGAWMIAPHMDLRVQRSLTIIPGISERVAPEALRSASSSTEWRLELYAICIENIPRYFFVGRGLSDDISEIIERFQTDSSGYGDPHFHYDSHSYHLAIFYMLIDYGGVAALLFYGSLFVMRKNVRGGGYSEAGYNQYAVALMTFSLISLVLVWSNFNGVGFRTCSLAYILCSSLLCKHAEGMHDILGKPDLVPASSHGGLRGSQKSEAGVLSDGDRSRGLR